MTSCDHSSLIPLRSINHLARAVWLLIVASLLPPLFFAQTAPIFPVTSYTTTSPEPFNSAAADFNGDGLVDIASVSYNSLDNASNTVITILLATSTPGTYTSSSLPPLPCLSTSNIVAADLNKDGKQDLVLSCGVYVVVLLGNGNGTFAAPAYYGVASPATVAVADLGGNGYPDIAVTSNRVQLTVLLNGGSSSPGTFTTGSSYPINGGNQSSGTLSILTGDFNGDGKADLALSSTNWGIFYGNGDGTLQPIQNTTAQGYAAAADFNHDGITDLAYGTTDSTGTIAEVQTLVGSASGLVSGPLSTFPYLAPQGQLSFAGSTGAGQFVNLTYSGVGPLSILVSDGKGGFTLGQSYVASGNVQPITTAMGVTSLLLRSSSLGYTVLTGNGDGTFQGIRAQPVPSGSSFAAADINGDGLTDVIVANTNLLSLVSRGDGSFTVVSSVPALSSQILLPGDFNGDGKQDVVGAQLGGGSINSPQVFFFAGHGDGTFDSGVTVPSLTGIQFTAGATGDFTGDGKLDILLGYIAVPEGISPTGCGLILFPGKGDGTFGSPVTVSQSCSSSTGPILVGDLNGDGKLDAIFAGDVYLGSSSGTLQQQPLDIVGTLALADLNSDGSLDLVVPSGLNVSLYAGRGDGTFQTTPYYTGSSASCDLSSSASTGKVDGPIPDFSINCGNTSNDGQFNLYLGSGGGVYPASPSVYILGDAGSTTASSFGTFARLNSNSPALGSDQYQDYLASSENAVIGLLNTHTAAPVLTTTNTLLTVSPTSSSFGSVETFTASVTPSNATGSVTFMDGSTSLSSAAFAGGTATFTTSTLPAGAHSITAVYAATGSYTSSTSAAVGLTITKAATTTSLTISPQSINPLQTVTLTANVGAGASGTIIFTLGTTALPAVTITNGVASVQNSSLTAGTYNVVAVYSGDANHLGSTSAIGSISVAAPAFTVAVNPTSITVTRGQSTQATFTITPVAGYTGSLTLSCGTIPSETSCVFNPATVTLNSTATGSSTLTFTTTAPSSADAGSSMGRISGIALASVLLLLCPGRRRKFGLLPILCLASIATLVGCGGSSNIGDRNLGTPIGTQSVTIGVTGANITHNVTLSITVQ